MEEVKAVASSQVYIVVVDAIESNWFIHLFPWIIFWCLNYLVPSHLELCTTSNAIYSQNNLTNF